MASKWQKRKCTKSSFSKMSPLSTKARILLRLSLKRKRRSPLLRMIHNLTPPLTVQSVSKWQAWCSKKSFDTTCSVDMVSEERAKVVMPSSDQISKQVVPSKQVLASSIKESLDYQLRVFHLRIRDLTVRMQISQAVKMFKMALKWMERDIVHRLNNSPLAT